MKRDEPTPTPPPEGSSARKVAFTALSILLPLGVLALCVVLVLQLNRDPSDELDGAAEAPTDPSTESPGDPIAPPPRPLEPVQPPVVDPAIARQQALEAMKQRYRPGPYVQVLGMQPSAEARGGVMSWMSRRGRTINNPWLVERGQLRSERAPSVSGGAGGPTLNHHPGEAVHQPITVVPGVPNRIRLRVSHPGGDDAIAGLHVAFDYYTGHFFIPAPGRGSDGEVGSIYVTEPDATSVTFGIDAAILPNGQPIPGPSPHPVTMYIGVEDIDGNISQYLTRQLQVVPVGSGDLEVTLTMSQATDLDLYVVEPTGVAIYYRNTNSYTGGHLDLDANAACSSHMGVNNEHVYWPRGQAPSGSYTVRVANYVTCIGGGQVDYQVTVRNCGEVAVFAGNFTGQGNSDTCTAPPGLSPTWCHDVVSFTVMPCQ